MKFGVREICDVVLRAKARQQVGNKIFYKNEPVIYFDSLKTSSMEGAATTVYAQGGKGNARLVAWEGERTVTFTMEDALISPAGFMILSGAGLISGADKPIQVHVTEQVKIEEDGVIYTQDKPYIIDGEDYIYVMKLDNNGEIATEPYIYTYDNAAKDENGYALTLKATKYTAEAQPKAGDIVLVDYYTEKTGEGVQQIEITADKFGGNYYLEASTLFRDQATGVDMPAEFIIPNCKIQSNFTFTMASSGDPSTFTFTMDAFPDYTRFDRTKKVLATIQIVSEAATSTDSVVRESTTATLTHTVNTDGAIVDKNPEEGVTIEDDNTITIDGVKYTLTEVTEG